MKDHKYPHMSLNIWWVNTTLSTHHISAHSVLYCLTSFDSQGIYILICITFNPQRGYHKSWPAINHTYPTKGRNIIIPYLLWVNFIYFTLQIYKEVMWYKCPHRPSYISKMRVALFDDCLSTLPFIFHLGFELSNFRIHLQWSLFPLPHEHLKV